MANRGVAEARVLSKLLDRVDESLQRADPSAGFVSVLLDSPVPADADARLAELRAELAPFDVRIVRVGNRPWPMQRERTSLLARWPWPGSLSGPPGGWN